MYGIMAMSIRDFKLDRNILHYLNLWGVFTVHDLICSDYKSYINSDETLPDNFHKTVGDFVDKILSLV